MTALPLLVLSGLAAALVAVISMLPAGATTKGPQVLTVSCDGVSIATGVRVVFGSNGTYKIRQNSTNPSVVDGIPSDTRTWAVSDNGNSLSVKTVSDGTTVSWTNVIKSGYTTKAYKAQAANCNGIGFGHGNYDWNYTVTYPG
jgi:plastocyanin